MENNIIRFQGILHKVIKWHPEIEDGIAVDPPNPDLVKLTQDHYGRGASFLYDPRQNVFSLREDIQIPSSEL